MKDRDNEKKFIFFKLRSFLEADKERKRVETTKAVAAAATATASTFSSRSSFRHNKNRHEKENKSSPRHFRHEKEYTFISFSTSYAKVSSISYSSIKTTFSPSQFYQQQPSVEIETASTFAVNPAFAFATGASAATNLTFFSNPNMPSQFQQSIAYNPFSSQSIGPAASSQQWQPMPSLTYTGALYTYPPSLSSAVTVLSPSRYAKEIENMKKLYKKNMKYSGSNDNFVHKLSIFHHFCDKSNISYEARSKAFSSMFKGFAFDYYLTNVNMLKHASLDQLCIFSCIHFEKSTNVRNNLIK